MAESDLDDEDRITLDMLKLAVGFGLDATRLRFDEMAVDQMAGPQVWLHELLNWHPTDTPEHVEQLIARYRSFGTHMSQYLANLADGMRDGRTAPRSRSSAWPRSCAPSSTSPSRRHPWWLEHRSSALTWLPSFAEQYQTLS
ncbi:MAG TPA: DUF885 family protein [Chloroflexota bacterium]